MKSAATALLLLPAVLGVASAKEAKRPNLVLMVVDDLVSRVRARGSEKAWQEALVQGRRGDSIVEEQGSTKDR